MIVTQETPRYEHHTVEEAGSLLPEADVLDEDGTGIKISQDREQVKITFDSISGRPKRARLTPDEADHLATLLTQYAKDARSW